MKCSGMVLTVTLAVMLSGCAVNPPVDEFLSDYTKLQPVDAGGSERMWLVDGAKTRALTYRAVMIDQPEIFISPASRYQGAKPDDLKLLADELRRTFRSEIEGTARFAVVDEADQDVVYLRVAISDLMLEKRRRPVVDYVPQVPVEDSQKAVRLSISKRIDVTHAKIEAEILDSMTNQALGAYVLIPANDGDVSWEELSLAFSGAGRRVACHLENATLAEQQRQDCRSIPLTRSRL